MTTLKTLGLGTLCLLIAAVAVAGPLPKGDFERTVKLDTSPYGREAQAFGYATMRSEDGIEMFGLRVFADLPDGTNLVVEVTNDKGVLEIGTIRMFLGSGALELYSSMLPSAAFPLSTVHAVTVRDTRDKLLTYTWERPSDQLR